MILAAVWCGRDKPVFDIFLREFVSEMQDLKDNGETSRASYSLDGTKIIVCLEFRDDIHR